MGYGGDFITRSIISLMITNVLIGLLWLIVYIPKEFRKEFNNSLVTKNRYLIRSGK